MIIENNHLKSKELRLLLYGSIGTEYPIPGNSYCFQFGGTSPKLPGRNGGLEGRMTKQLGYLMVWNERSSFFFLIPLNNSYKTPISPSSDTPSAGVALVSGVGTGHPLKRVPVASPDGMAAQRLPHPKNVSVAPRASKKI